MSVRRVPEYNHGVSQDGIPMSRREMLFVLRGIQEAEHRKRVWQYDAWRGWMQFGLHQPINFDSLEGLRLEDANSCCNRTAPIFAFRGMEETGLNPGYKGPQVPVPFLESFLIHTHIYIYGRWFHPYRSEIDHGQFLTKMNLLKPLEIPQGRCSPSLVDFVRSLSANLISRVKYTKQHKLSVEEQETGQTLYHLQPSFEAVAVSIRMDKVKWLAPNVMNLPVVIVRTGIEKGLSAPITFDSIPADRRMNVCLDPDGSIAAVETRLSEAVTFLLELEQRELQVFGPRPDPKKTTQNLTKTTLVGSVGMHARGIGWNKSKMGALNGPSSTWVDWKKRTTWEGAGQKYDERIEELRQVALRWSQNTQMRIDKEWEKVLGEKRKREPLGEIRQAHIGSGAPESVMN